MASSSESQTLSSSCLSQEVVKQFLAAHSTCFLCCDFVGKPPYPACLDESQATDGMEQSQLANVAGKQQRGQGRRQWWSKRWQAWLQEGPIAAATAAEAKGCGKVKAGEQRAQGRTCLSKLRIYAFVGIFFVSCSYYGCTSCFGSFVGGQSWSDDPRSLEGFYDYGSSGQDFKDQGGDLIRAEEAEPETQSCGEAGASRGRISSEKGADHGIQGLRERNSAKRVGEVRERESRVAAVHRRAEGDRSTDRGGRATVGDRYRGGGWCRRDIPCISLGYRRSEQAGGPPHQAARRSYGCSGSLSCQVSAVGECSCHDKCRYVVSIEDATPGRSRQDGFFTAAAPTRQAHTACDSAVLSQIDEDGRRFPSSPRWFRGIGWFGMICSQSTLEGHEFEFRVDYVPRIRVLENSTCCSGSPVFLVCIVSSLHDQVDRGPLLGSMSRKILFGSSLDFPIDPFTCTARENRLFEVSGSLESGHARIRFGGPFSGLGVWYGLAYTVYIHPNTPTRFFTWWFEKSAEGCTSTYHSICSCGQSQFNNCRGRNEEGCASCDERPSDISRRLRIRNHGNDYVKYVQGCTLCSHGRRRHYSPNADQLFNAFQWLWMIQWIGKGYLVWLQLLIYFGCRLCLLHFKRGSQFAGEEFCWHILRGVCWSFITFLGLWFYSRTPPRRLVKIQRRRFSIPARPCHRINHSGWIFSCLLLSSHVSAAFQALPETLTNSSVLSPSTDQNWNSDAAQVSMCSRGMPWYHLFDKGDDLQTIDVSWASTASGSSRVRGNDTSLVYDPEHRFLIRIN